MRAVIPDEEEARAFLRLLKVWNLISTWPGRKRPALRAPWLCLLLLAWFPSAFGVTYRWSLSSYRIYVTGPGAVLLSDIKTALPNAPLTQVAPGIWHLRADLQMENGATLMLHGTKIGGDVNELRLQSNNSPTTNSVVSVTADWGNIDIRSTTITSWDDAAQGPDTECAAYQRAFIRVRSSLDEDGVTAHESRMDVIDSDVGYLGCHVAESYGLVWKVNPPKENQDYGPLTNLYNLVNVYGEIRNSHIHHNFFGVYTFGAYAMQMVNNEVDHNVWYGFDPHDDSDLLVIEGNNVHDNGTHGIIGSQRCDHAIIRNNTSWNNGGCGIMLHRYTDYALVEGNKCLHNGDAGIAIFDSYHATVRGNTCWHNFKSGIRLSVGSADNLIENNDFGFSSNFGFYLYKGNDAPRPGDDGRPKRNQFAHNRVHDNAGGGIFLIAADDNSFTANLFSGNPGALWFVNARRNLVESNGIPPETAVATQGSADFPATTSVRNQAALNIQVDGYSSTRFEDLSGRVFDPGEEGILSTVNSAGTTLALTAAEIGKNASVVARNFQVVPDAGQALVTISFWNTSRDLSKRWLVQAGSATHLISYRVGDLVPNTAYRVLRNGVASKVTSDVFGNVRFQDKAVTTGLIEYLVTP